MARALGSTTMPTDHDDRSTSRRRFLGGLGAAGLAAVAGCTGVLGAGDDGTGPTLPGFATHLAPTGDALDSGPEGGYRFVAAEDVLADDTGSDTGTDTDTGTETGSGSGDDLLGRTDGDLMLQYPLLTAAFGLGFEFLSLQRRGLLPVVRDQSEGPATLGLDVNGVKVVPGTFDVDATATAIREADSPSLRTERRTEDAAVLGVESGALAVGVTEEGVYIAERSSLSVEPRTVVDTHLATVSGETRTKAEQDPLFETLLTRARTDGIVSGVYAAEPLSRPALTPEQDGGIDLRAFAGARGFVHQLEAMPEDPAEGGSRQVDATTTVVYPTAADTDPDGLRSALGGNATDRTVETDGEVVRVEATFEL